MSFFTERVVRALMGRPGCRRGFGRNRVESIKCNLGIVLDLSGGGMRVLSTRPRSGKVVMRMTAYGGKLRVDSRVIWSRRIGFRRHVLGVAFRQIDGNASKVLARLSTDHRKVSDTAA